MESENKKVEYGMEGSTIKVSIDKDQDGKKSMVLKLNMSEAMQEAFNKGESIEGMKKVKISFSGGMVKIGIDSDQDGENVLDLELEVMETLKEAGVIK